MKKKDKIDKQKIENELGVRMKNLYSEYKKRLDDMYINYLRTNKADKALLLAYKQELYDNQFMDLFSTCIFILGNYLLRIGDYDLFVEILNDLQNVSNQDYKFPAIYEYILAGTFHWIKNENYEKSLECLEKAKKTILENEIDESLLYYHILHQIGVVYASKNDNKRAYEYLLEAINCRLHESNEFHKATSYHWLGIIESKFFNTDKALDNFLRSVELFKKKDLLYPYAQVLNSIGLLYIDLEKYDQAYIVYQEALDIAKRNNFIDSLEDTHNNIGFYYYCIKDYTKAENHYFSALDHTRRTQHIQKLGHIKANLGLLYRDMALYEKAREHHFSALNLALILNNTRFIFDLHCDIIEFFLRQKDYKNAQKYIAQAENLSAEINDDKLKMRIYEILTNYYEGRNQFRNALKYIKMLRKIENILQNTQTQTNFEILNIKGKVERIVDDYEKKIENEKIDAIKAMAVTTSHDINQPLTILQFSVEMLRRDDMGLDYSPKQLKYVDIIQECITKISDILQRYNSNENYTITQYVDNVKMVKFKDR